MKTGLGKKRAMARTAKNPITGLTEKQEAFAFEAVRLGDPYKAYRVAYEAGGMGIGSVRAEVAKLFKHPAIVGRIEHYRQMADRKLEVSIERIAKEVARIAFYDPRELYDEAGQMIPLERLPEDIARAIAGVDVKDIAVGKGEQRQVVGTVKKYRLASKIDALTLLAKWKRMISDRPGEEVVDPNDVRQLSDEELEAELRATEEALKVHERAQGRRRRVH